MLQNKLVHNGYLTNLKHKCLKRHTLRHWSRCRENFISVSLFPSNLPQYLVGHGNHPNVLNLIPSSLSILQPSVPSMLLMCRKRMLPSLRTAATSWKMAPISSDVKPITSIACCEHDNVYDLVIKDKITYSTVPIHYWKQLMCFCTKW